MPIVTISPGTMKGASRSNSIARLPRNVMRPMAIPAGAPMASASRVVKHAIVMLPVSPGRTCVVGEKTYRQARPLHAAGSTSGQRHAKAADQMTSGTIGRMASTTHAEIIALGSVRRATCRFGAGGSSMDAARVIVTILAIARSPAGDESDCHTRAQSPSRAGQSVH